MSTPSTGLPMAGDYLVATFAEMMHSARFRKHVWSRMQLAERRRLESLRLQALYGDAPDHRTRATTTTLTTTGSGSSGAGVAETTKPEEPAVGEARGDAHTAAASPAHLSSPPTSASPSPPRWFDIAGKARYNAWVALRGCMTADVAAECFCAEFLGVVKKYPHPALLTPIEAALSTAQGLAQRTRSSSANKSENGILKEQQQQHLLNQRATSTHTPSSDGAATGSAATPELCVRALQGDPAALALLWLCRAYRIPCEFIVEPLSKALSSSAASHTTTKAAASPLPAAAAPSNPYLAYTLADACFPFEASLRYPGGATAAAASDTTTVTTPEAAFVLMADTFLSAYPHWMDMPSDLPPAPGAAAASSAQTSLLLLRCGWIDELLNITRHLRTPILAMLVHHATQSSATVFASQARAADRQALLRAVAAHLHRYEAWTMARVVHRRVGQALSVLSPLLASTAVVDALRHAYAPDAKAVTAADVYLASCGYVLCTHPFCADVFPMLRVPVDAADVGTGVRAEWPAAKTEPTRAAAASGASATYAPWALPLYLSGLPAECNATINRVLRRESSGAAQHEQRQQSVRLLLNDTSAATTAPQQQQQQQQVGGASYYAVSSASATKEAAEAVGQLILSRLYSVQRDDLQHDAQTPCTSSVSGVPFLVLGQVLALSWALAQEQVPAFPYFMLDGNPDHAGGFSFLQEDAVRGGASQRSRRRFRVSLAPASVLPASTATASSLPAMVPGSAATASASSNDGGVSIESRLRRGLHGMTAAVLKGTRRFTGGSKDDESQSSRNGGVHATHVLRSDGGGSSLGGGSGAAAAGQTASL